ncbi:MAG: hypothetical protein NZM00_06030 [Anaerolinea sp.]|nr:hypothetical protein [Anaerolinea sp.]
MRNQRSGIRSSPASARGVFLLAVIMLIAGILLLLNNFHLLGTFDALSLWPLLLIAAGGLILLRGDLSPSSAGRSFGITRGSVEAAVLEIQSGEIDVLARALPREGRLIAGTFARDGRPQLIVEDNQATLIFERAATPWSSFADWDLGLARDLPWRIAVSSSLGAVHFDMSALIVQGALIATGFGDIVVTLPHEAFEPITLRSALGNVRVQTPNGVNAWIQVQPSRLFRLHVDHERYEQVKADLYHARAADPQMPQVQVILKGMFGDAYLA